MFDPRLIRDKKPVGRYGFSNVRTSEETANINRSLEIYQNNMIFTDM